MTETSPDVIEVSVAIATPSKYNVAIPPVASPATTVALAVRLVFVAVSLFARTTPSTGVTTRDVGATGATVSTAIAAFAASEPVAPGDISVTFAMLPAVSLIDPPFSNSDAVETKSRSVVTSPATTVYLNVATASDALRYRAAWSVAPVSSNSVGTPAPVVTAMFSLNVTVTSITAPTLYMPFAVVDCTDSTRGAVVSTVMFSELVALNTSLAFLNEPASTEIVAVPEKPVLGVNVAVYVVPEPVKPEIVPPADAMSSAPKSVLT